MQVGAGFEFVTHKKCVDARFMAAHQPTMCREGRSTRRVGQRRDRPPLLMVVMRKWKNDDAAIADGGGENDGDGDGGGALCRCP